MSSDVLKLRDIPDDDAFQFPCGCVYRNGHASRIGGWRRVALLRQYGECLDEFAMVHEEDGVAALDHLSAALCERP